MTLMVLFSESLLRDAEFPSALLRASSYKILRASDLPLDLLWLPSAHVIPCSAATRDYLNLFFN